MERTGSDFGWRKADVDTIDFRNAGELRVGAGSLHVPHGPIMMRWSSAGRPVERLIIGSYCKVHGNSRGETLCHTYLVVRVLQNLIQPQNHSVCYGGAKPNRRDVV